MVRFEFTIVLLSNMDKEPQNPLERSMSIHGSSQRSSRPGLTAYLFDPKAFSA